MNAFRIRIPDEVDPAGLFIGFGMYGRGLKLLCDAGKPGVRDHAVRLWDTDLQKVERAKLLLCRTGWRAFTAELGGDELRAMRAFEPRFEPLPTERLKGRLLTAKGEPLASARICFTYFLAEAADYFGYADGMTPPLEVAHAITGTDGTFAVELPVWRDDPFFAASVARASDGRPGFGTFEITTEGEDGRRQGVLIPPEVSLEGPYPEPFPLFCA
jgi:hypothetical protein